MSDHEPIPLYDGELSGAVILMERAGFESGHSAGVRAKRTSARHEMNDVLVAFAPQLSSGRLEFAACPLVNMSAGGVAIVFDEPLKVGMSGIMAYRTLSHEPVRITVRVRRCEPCADGRFEIGLQTSRPLRREEQRPARIRPGRELTPDLRPRRLRDVQAEYERT